MIEYYEIRPVPGPHHLPGQSEAPVKLFPRKRETSIETDPELRSAFGSPAEAQEDFDDDAFARAIAEGRARDPEAYGGQKIA